MVGVTSVGALEGTSLGSATPYRYLPFSEFQRLVRIVGPWPSASVRRKSPKAKPLGSFPQGPLQALFPYSLPRYQHCAYLGIQVRAKQPYVAQSGPHFPYTYSERPVGNTHKPHRRLYGRIVYQAERYFPVGLPQQVLLESYTRNILPTTVVYSARRVDVEVKAAL